MNTTAAARTASPLLSDAPLGEVTRDGDLLQVVFNRHYNASIERVWAALTTPERLADWLATAEIDLRVGGAMHLRWNEENQADMRITVCDPPRSFAWLWKLGSRDTLVRFDLASHGGGCDLTLTHSGVPPTGAGVRAGWHAHLDALPEAIEGYRTSWQVKQAREAALGDAYPALRT